jgi:hypothetical protein
MTKVTIFSNKYWRQRCWLSNSEFIAANPILRTAIVYGTSATCITFTSGDESGHNAVHSGDLYCWFSKPQIAATPQISVEQLSIEDLHADLCNTRDRR